MSSALRVGSYRALQQEKLQVAPDKANDGELHAKAAKIELGENVVRDSEDLYTILSNIYYILYDIYI